MTASNHLQQLYSELVILCGPPRSGTTWLNRELCNAPMAFPFLPECTFLTQQAELYHRTLRYGDHQRIKAYFGSDQELRNYFRLNVARLIDQAANLNPKPNAKTLVLKDPGLCLCLEDIKDVLPPHKLVVLVRDPRDVVASMKAVTARKQEKWDVKQAAEQLINYYYQIGNHQQRADGGCIFVRYEDMVVGQTQLLKEFLRLPITGEAGTGSVLSDIKMQLDVSDPFYSALYLQPTTTNKVGSYVRVLSKKEIRHVEAVYAAILRHWAYQVPPSVKTAISRLIRR